VNAAVGCLARIPLPLGAFRPLRAAPASPAPAGAPQPGAGGGGGAARRRRGRIPPRFGAELWAPHLRDTALRVCASFGASAQARAWRCRGTVSVTVLAQLLNELMSL
jgi:hypothetical protein